MAMTEREKRYWEGIAKAKNELRPRPKTLERCLKFLDDALQFVKMAKGKVEHKEPTEMEFYKRWVSLQKR
jgi:hypothetical protein